MDPGVLKAILALVAISAYAIVTKLDLNRDTGRTKKERIATVRYFKVGVFAFTVTTLSTLGVDLWTSHSQEIKEKELALKTDSLNLTRHQQHQELIEQELQSLHEIEIVRSMIDSQAVQLDSNLGASLLISSNLKASLVQSRHITSQLDELRLPITDAVMEVTIVAPLDRLPEVADPMTFDTLAATLAYDGDMSRLPARSGKYSRSIHNLDKQFLAEISKYHPVYKHIKDVLLSSTFSLQFAVDTAPWKNVVMYNFHPAQYKANQVGLIHRGDSFVFVYSLRGDLPLDAEPWLNEDLSLKSLAGTIPILRHLTYPYSASYSTQMRVVTLQVVFDDRFILWIRGVERFANTEYEHRAYYKRLNHIQKFITRWSSPYSTWKGGDFQ